MDILRFLTAGSVDDGKSTLIGRLLYDSKSILVDQLEAIEKQSKTQGNIDLALLTDGLRAEREQGITIDVAYKYFSTPKRKFIIADTPGHIQYTRNMITGASNADLAIILIDARHGIVEQTRRHSIIASLLQIPNVVVAINKMDLVKYDQNVFETIVADYKKMATTLHLKNIFYIPICAVTGENIVHSSDHLKWFTQPPLLDYLEQVDVEKENNFDEPRFVVQYVIRPQTEALHDYRGYAGKILNGTYHVGDTVTIAPMNVQSKIAAIEMNGKQINQASNGQSVILHLADDVDVSRGDSILLENNNALFGQEIAATLCWMDTKSMNKNGKYILQLNSRRERIAIKNVRYKINVNTLEKENEVNEVSLNDIVDVVLKSSKPIVYDAYNKLRVTGGAILIDETSNLTVAALLLHETIDA